MNFKKLLATILSFILILSSASISYAYEDDFGKYDIPSDLILENIEMFTFEFDEYDGDINNDKFVYEKIKNPSIQIKKRIVDNEYELGETERELVGYTYEKENSDISIMEWGSGGPVAKIFNYTSASAGLLRKGSKTGTYIAIATAILPFVKDWKISVQGIFAATGLVAGGQTYSKAETYISKKYYYKEGRVRAASDPDTDRYYYPAIKTGRSETFRHVMSATLNQSTMKWSTKTHDYKTAIDPKSSPHYYDTAYILNYARNYFYLGNYYDETGVIK